MPVYSFEQLIALKDSDLVVVPEFKWNDIETVPKGTNVYQENNNHSSWRRGSHNSHNAKRPVVMPKAAIPFSQRALFDSKAAESQSAVSEEQDNEDEDEDEFAARYLLKTKPKSKKVQDAEDETGAPVVNLSYAAALAASMKMNEAESATTGEEVAADGDDAGWVSVSHQNKPRRNRNKGSFSKWRS